jgi:hypothetical protein|tara:strand:- start:1067 stop:1213 length:147 start_codon:yes stop_codon:yes gene_type:complete
MYRVDTMKVNLMRKLWKEKVEVPVLKRKIDKILKVIDVKLKKRSKDVG